MKLTYIGQSGFILKIGLKALLFDPYLSNSVEIFYGRRFKRVTPIYPTNLILNIVAIFLTHHHLDHCDPTSLKKVQKQNPHASIFGTRISIKALRHYRNLENLKVIKGNFLNITKDLKIHFMPAAHPKIVGNARDGFRFLGFGVVYKSLRIYFSGDTSLNPKVIQHGKSFRPTHAVLPVNERNYYRDKAGIVGNLTIREAFGFCAEIGATTLIPCHWDMFSINSASPDEITAVYQSLHPRPSFRIKILRPFQSLTLN